MGYTKDSKSTSIRLPFHIGFVGLALLLGASCDRAVSSPAGEGASENETSAKTTAGPEGQPIPTSGLENRPTPNTWPVEPPGNPAAGELWVDSAANIGFRAIPHGSFTMGGPIEHLNTRRLKVTLTRDYWLAETEITRQQWDIIMSDKDNSKRGPSRGFPEDSVTWWQAVEFANRLSQKSGLEECYELAVAEAGAPGDQHPDPQFLGLDCEGYRLPTEAEWERAALAGSNTLFSGGDDLEAYGWYESNSDRKVHRCAEKAPNAWGLYDMSGNLNEWVWDETRNSALLVRRRFLCIRES